MKHLTEEQFILYHYREGKDLDDYARHLTECASCRAAYGDLTSVLDSLQRWPIPERSDQYGEQVWCRIQHRLQPSAEAAPRFRLFWPVPRWAMAMSMLLLLAGAFFLGYYWPYGKNEKSGPSLLTDSGQRILQVSLLEHLDRSQRVLQELAHQRGNGSINILTEQDSIRDLLAENRLYRQVSSRSGQAGLTDLLDELEYLFLQLSHRPAILSSTELLEMQKRLESAGILFKLHIMRSRLHEQEDIRIRDLSRRAS